MNIINWYFDLESEFNIIDVGLFVAGMAALVSAAFRMMSPPLPSANKKTDNAVLMVIGGTFIVRSSCRFVHQYR